VGSSYSEARPLLERASDILREAARSCLAAGIPVLRYSEDRRECHPDKAEAKKLLERAIKSYAAEHLASPPEVRLQAAAANSINERQEALTMKIPHEAHLATIVQRPGQLPWAK
jgi:hypothetical protein